ncbi:DNA-processing protein DprA [Paenibacillus sp. JX-17]|uniref:DNA-processing protein DprA n=1 Tax=Paenibacillus lacisoli TaxID=3064525 RepID=A0ABT9CB14_9BACL|nr:DNA-processing protein DprA [Paenibacillus sp. JX-17]MDO7905844.1 DNA-processing protein DprA [Paenibacillus sp. JX-17]
MEERLALLGLHEMEGIGKKTIRRYQQAGYRWQDCADLTAEEWIRLGLPAHKARETALKLNHNWIEERASLLQQGGISYVTALDDDYPYLMKETVEPPWVLYLKGKAELLHSLSVAMVGTRVPTAYGRKVGEMLAEGLSRAGITVVSGMARGIDSVCHQAALEHHGQTIAVLGTGLDRIYPPEHTGLYHRIAEEGLIVTEYPLGTKPHPGLFPLRNRIIAGLSKGTVVVEADLRSGSLITADAALESGRDVFAVPGPITSPKSQGCLNLIKQGAKTVTNIEDILEEYVAWLQNTPECHYNRKRSLSQVESGRNEEGLGSEERKIHNLLEQGPLLLDELLEATGWHFGLLHSVLLSLIIKKQIAQLPGAKYELI